MWKIAAGYENCASHYNWEFFSILLDLPHCKGGFFFFTFTGLCTKNLYPRLSCWGVTAASWGRTFEHVTVPSCVSTGHNDYATHIRLWPLTQICIPVTLSTFWKSSLRFAHLTLKWIQQTSQRNKSKGQGGVLEWNFSCLLSLQQVRVLTFGEPSLKLFDHTSLHLHWWKHSTWFSQEA